MNMQKIMIEAQKMQAKLKKEQEEIEKTTYDGTSSLVNVTINGKKEIVKININFDDDFSIDDKELIEDMVMLAVNDAIKKADLDKENRLGKYGQGLTGLM